MNRKPDGRLASGRRDIADEANRERRRWILDPRRQRDDLPGDDEVVRWRARRRRGWRISWPPAPAY
ncbi:MAG TPA: hypothetical protein PKA95_12245 [Thermomicrobiales bacterium]|nr:hypothetical protein [Thermomicrobiales bacterium]